MLPQAMRISGDEPAHRADMTDSTLADRSLELYDFLGESYLQLDKCRGDDMDIIAKETAKYSQGCRILDAGCGPGKHVEHCSQLPFVKDVKGVDFSTGMIAAARLRACDIPKGARVMFQVHDLLKPLGTHGVFDIVLCMNNVLGNVVSANIDTADDDRKRLLENLHAAIKRTGLFVFSVYMRAYLPAKCPHGEEEEFSLGDGSRIEAGDLIISFSPMESTNKLEYYSHWFNQVELTNLLSSTGFVIRSQVSRPPRVILVAQRASSSTIHSSADP